MREFTLIGVILILLGIAFVIVPVLSKYVNPQELPNWIIYVYQSGDFYFATSPILILFSAIFLILSSFY